MEKLISEKLQPSTVRVLKAVRESEIGTFLDAGTGNTSDDILLHKQQQTSPVAIGDEVKVFLYRDPKGRLTASMRVPKMREGQVARVRVINTSRDGAFVDVGAERGIFMPFAGMRGCVKEGDLVWVLLYSDKSGRLAVTMEVEDALRRASRSAEGVERGTKVTGSLYNYGDNGAFLFTKERYIAFLHFDEMTYRPKVGEEIEVRVTFVREDGRINVSMRQQKELAMDTDAETILKMLTERGGKMPYSDDTSADVIKAKFQLSKSAFKRALGRLMKSGKVEQKDGWTHLKEQ